MSLRTNVFAAVVTATGALVLTLLLLADPLVEHRLTRHVRDDLAAAAEAAADRLDDGEPADRIADRVGAERGCHITIVDEDGLVLGDTALDLAELGQPVAEAIDEIARARSDGHGYSVRRPSAMPSPALYVAVRASGGRVVRAVRPLSTIEATRESTRELVILGGIIAGIAAALLTIALSRTLVRPIEELTRAADALARGDLDARTNSERDDELGRLGRALDRMAELLQERLEAVRAEEARLQAMLDAMVEAVFVTDKKGIVVLTNRALSRLAAGPVRGRTVMEALDNADLAAAVRSALHGQPEPAEIELQVGTELRTLEAQLALLPERAGLVAVLHDVTDLKRADAVRRDFVANASHELRTPLTAIRGYAETLRAGAASDPATSTRFLDTILRHTTRLQRLVDDLLALSRSESADQEFVLGPVDVGSIAAEVISSLESQARGRDIHVTREGFDGLPPALANAWALDHVLVNLVDNAVKYTPSGGRVRVRGHADDDHVIVAVSDTGPGIMPSQRERIFERFYRVDSGRKRDQGGTGLGLAIVKHLVQRMNATIAVESERGAGTTFRVSLPRASTNAAEVA